MNNVYKFTDHRSGGNPADKSGYIKVHPKMIGNAYTYVRGCCKSSFVIGKLSYSEDFKEIQKGYSLFDTLTDPKERAEILSTQKKLIDMMEFNKKLPLSAVTDYPDYYTIKEGKYSTMYVSCDGGVMAAGWYGEPESSRKGLIMCAYLLYMIGFLNPGTDETLWKSTYNYLLYETGYGEPEALDALIINTIREEITDKNSTPPKKKR